MNRSRTKDGVATSKFWLPLAGLLIALCASAGCAPVAVVPDAAMFTGETGGCGFFSVYRFNRSQMLAIDLNVDEEGFNLKEGNTEIEIENAPARVDLKVMQWASPAGDYFCNDVGVNAQPFETWTAVSGQLHIECGQRPPRIGNLNANHRVSVILKNIKIRNVKTGNTTTLPYVEIKDVVVGGIPG